MKSAKLIIILILLTQAVNAQKGPGKKKSAVSEKPPVNEYETIDQKALQIPDSMTRTTDSIASYINSNFSIDKEKARAIFIWIASNIQYDIDNMFAINFYEPVEEKISKPLKTRKGICENYAALFTAICSKVGIPSYVIPGYTKQNGFTDYIPHAWCIALFDGSWYMMDPTWGSGYVENGRFYKKINNNYFKAKPSWIIKTHMPFDYLWQCLYYPVTSQEFYEGKIQPDTSKPYFDYVDSMVVYEKLSHIEQLSASASRIEKNGLKNAMIFDRLQHIKLEIENDRQTGIANLFNSASAEYNEGIRSFNEFIQYRNKQFTPIKKDSEIQSMIDSVEYKFKEAKAKLRQIQNPDTNITTMIAQLSKTIDDATGPLKDQQAWLKLYLSRGKAGRKSLFYEKVTYTHTSE